MGLLTTGKSNMNLAGLHKEQTSSPTPKHNFSSISLMTTNSSSHNINGLLHNSQMTTNTKDHKNIISPVASSAQISGKLSGELILFDIRIDKSNDTSYTTPIDDTYHENSFSNSEENYFQDIIIIKGASQEDLNAENVLITGKIVLGVSQPIPMKKLTLRLVGDVKTRIPVGENDLERYSTFDKRIYDKLWDYKYFKSYLFPENNRQDTATPAVASKDDSQNLRAQMMHKRTKSGANLKRLASFSNLSFSANSLPTLSTTGLSSNDILQPGNYELPFKFTVSSAIAESLELKECTVNYQFTCMIERTSKKSDLYLKKKLKIIRTLSSDSTDLSETVLVSNTWPNKIDYALSTPAKSNIIGSSVPVRFEFVPLSKGLKLGSIKIQLIEQISVFSPVVGTKSFERVCSKKKIADPLRSSRYYDEDLVSNFYEEIIPPEKYVVEDKGEFLDKWDVIVYLDTPSSLSKICQDCVVGNFVKIRHKLKFVVGLINTDDHVSELRASLPLQFFISPFVPVTAKSFYVDPVFHKNSNPNFAADMAKEDDIYLFDESKNLLVDSVMKAYKVASFERLNALVQQPHDNVLKVDFINGNIRPQLESTNNSKSTPLLSTFASHSNEINSSNVSNTYLPKIKNNSSEKDLFEYSKKHSSIVISDMMTPPSYTKRVYDQLLAENSGFIKKPNSSDGAPEDLSKTKKNKNSYSNQDLNRLRHGISNISLDEQINLQYEHAENTNKTAINKLASPELSRIPSYHDAMLSSTKMQNSNVEIRDLPPVYNPKWDEEYKNTSDVSQPLRNNMPAIDGVSSSIDSSIFLNESSGFIKPSKQVKTARFQLGVGMTPINTGGEHLSLSKENSSKSLNAAPSLLSRSNSAKNMTKIFGFGQKD
ncbi:hypothetical protein QEN19_003359 [Hanseniaspora menglaensis]